MCTGFLSCLAVIIYFNDIYDINGYIYKQHKSNFKEYTLYFILLRAINVSKRFWDMPKRNPYYLINITLSLYKFMTLTKFALIVPLAPYHTFKPTTNLV